MPRDAEHALEENAGNVLGATDRDDLALEVGHRLDRGFRHQLVRRFLRLDPSERDRRALVDGANRVNEPLPTLTLSEPAASCWMTLALDWAKTRSTLMSCAANNPVFMAMKIGHRLVEPEDTAPAITVSGAPPAHVNTVRQRKSAQPEQDRMPCCALRKPGRRIRGVLCITVKRALSSAGE